MFRKEICVTTCDGSDVIKCNFFSHKMFCKLHPVVRRLHWVRQSGIKSEWPGGEAAVPKAFTVVNGPL